MSKVLDPHCEEILEEYRQSLPGFEQSRTDILDRLRQALDKAGIIVASMEARVKTEASLTGKLELKGGKYASLADIPISSVCVSSRSI